jgi:thiol-disulfide isomerase/thioredoxin
MRTLTLLFFLLFSIYGFGQKSMPDVMIKSLDGQSVSTKKILENKLTLISFWATWCGPCKVELDALKSVYPSWQEKYGLQIVAITIDNPRQLSKVAPMIKAKGWPYLFFEDSIGNLKNKLNFQSIPQSYLVDRNGKVVWSNMGYAPGVELEIEKQILKTIQK